MADGLNISPTEPMLLQGDCLELMRTLPAKSVDLFLCDLPYGETNCSWDTKIDMVEFWKEFKRIRRSKRTACIHFCSTGFGYSLIKSWEKGFKMDMVWKKRNKTGGLQSRYRPMRNHEMIYFFYEQAPKYNRDKYHKRIKAIKEHTKETVEGDKTYGSTSKMGKPENFFEPPNPASVQEEREYWDDQPNDSKTGHGWDKSHMNTPRVPSFDPSLPASVQEEQPDLYGEKLSSRQRRRKEKGSGGAYEHHPPNPASVQEDNSVDIYGEPLDSERFKQKKFKHAHHPPNPASVQEDNSVDIFDEIEEPHLAPFSVYEGTKCFIGKRNHQTEKPQDILEFILKYWTDEGDVVLDPTMGSGSTGVACKKLGRSFIGMELTDKYFGVAKKRIAPEASA
jgi:DNA modification methylase